MILKRFQVTNFRSVINSGWIDCDNITSLVGVNEAGKSNLLLALWKLNPAREEGDAVIETRDDMPRGFYTEWKDKADEIGFITAEFELDNDILDKISSTCSCKVEDVQIVHISRYFDGERTISFPNYTKPNKLSADLLKGELTSAQDSIGKMAEATETIPSKNEGEDDVVVSESGNKESVLNALQEICDFVKGKKTLTADDFVNIMAMFPTGLKQLKSSKIIPALNNIKHKISCFTSILSADNPSEIDSIYDLILNEMPSFVYYSDYGNLDAEIYMPEAVEMLKKSKAKGFVSTAKVRTLRMLFEFVNLDANLIWELGKDPALYKEV